MNVLVLLAGSSAPFREAGYPYPKSLIEIAGIPAIERVIAPFCQLEERGAKFIFAVRQEENRKYHLGMVLHLLKPKAKIVEIPGETAGAACTALLAIEAIDDGDSLLIVNGDQIVNHDVAAVVDDFQERGLDGGTLVFKAIHPRWSYVKCDASGRVIEAAEKRPISNLATAGFYWFAKGSDFVQAAERMIIKDAHVDNVFFICPIFNEMILIGKHIGVHVIPSTSYESLMTPTHLRRYEEKLLRQMDGP